MLCGDATSPEAVSRLLGERQPFLMVTDPPYGIELDSEWRDRAGLNGRGPAEPSYLKQRTEGASANQHLGRHARRLVRGICAGSQSRSGLMSGTPRNSPARFSMACCESASCTISRSSGTRGAPCSPEPITGFSMSRAGTSARKTLPGTGRPGENSTIWDSPSPKFIMGGSDEEKFDHPTQKPVELMRRPILNHTKRGELVYDPFLGSGTTLAAAEVTERVCYGLELDPKYADVVIQRWQALSHKQATLEGDGRTFDAVARERMKVAA